VRRRGFIVGGGAHALVAVAGAAGGKFGVVGHAFANVLNALAVLEVVNVAGFQRAFDDTVVVVGALDLESGFFELLDGFGEAVFVLSLEDHGYVADFGVAGHGGIVREIEAGAIGDLII